MLSTLAFAGLSSLALGGAPSGKYHGTKTVLFQHIKVDLATTDEPGFAKFDMTGAPGGEVHCAREAFEQQGTNLVLPNVNTPGDCAHDQFKAANLVWEGAVYNEQDDTITVTAKYLFKTVTVVCSKVAEEATELEKRPPSGPHHHHFHHYRGEMEGEEAVSVEVKAIVKEGGSRHRPHNREHPNGFRPHGRRPRLGDEEGDSDDDSYSNDSDYDSDYSESGDGSDSYESGEYDESYESGEYDESYESGEDEALLGSRRHHPHRHHHFRGPRGEKEGIFVGVKAFVNDGGRRDHRHHHEGRFPSPTDVEEFELEDFNAEDCPSWCSLIGDAAETVDACQPCKAGRLDGKGPNRPHLPFPGRRYPGGEMEAEREAVAVEVRVVRPEGGRHHHRHHVFPSRGPRAKRAFDNEETPVAAFD